MKIGILHQYSLYGSGSSVYARDMTKYLARLGHEVHLISLEPHPENYNFFDAAYVHRDDDSQLLFRRTESPSCISHTLAYRPVPVAYDRIDLPDTKHFVALSDLEIEDYVTFFLDNVGVLAARYAFDVIHAHHTVLPPYIACLVKEKLGIPYVVTVHGSIIEYVILRDARYKRHATEGLQEAGAVIVLNEDVRTRVLRICPGIEPNLAQIPVGVDGDTFRPVPAERRPAAVNRLIQHLKTREKRGKTAQLQRQTQQAAEIPDEEELAAAAALDIQNRYNSSYPDADLPHKLARIDWQEDNVLIYFGKLLFDKGVHCLIAALPNIMAAAPGVKLLIIGSGMDREFLEMGVAALDQGRLDRFRRVMQAGMAGRKERAAFYKYISCFWESVDQAAYVNRAQGRMLQNVIFTGYMTRADLATLLPCARVALVPSIIKEAFPLVSIESLACGVIPIASYFSGLAPILDEIAADLGAPGELAKIGHSPAAMMRDLSQNVPALLSALGGDSKAISATCRRLVEQKYRWRTVISEIEGLYKALRT
ncbi:MAG: glycosyltransferase family 4 protein [Chloroflexota bacterium]|nr:glycosyltransferase family 4 protein [Chloroflexota bacterium]